MDSCQIDMLASPPVCRFGIASNNVYSLFSIGETFQTSSYKMLGSLSSKDVFIFSLFSRRRSRVGGGEKSTFSRNGQEGL